MTEIPPTPLKVEKSLIRQDMRHRRIAYHQTINQKIVNEKLLESFGTLHISRDKIISGYVAKGSEINIMPLLEALYERGHPICLPVVLPNNPTLIFRQWTPQSPLVLDAASVLAPESEAAILEPDILLIPLIAFDGQCRRLGQGMGYYDKTLKQLAENHPIIVIGMAYDMQKIDIVPTKTKDYVMDMVITDKGLYTNQG